jgi:DedD protein
MEQELKQRLIGATVITALAAIFVPMLFDDPVKDTGKNVSTLKVPEVPAKVQDVEIIPLPEKVEEVVAQSPAEKSPQSAPVLKESAEEGIREVPQPRPQPAIREAVPAPTKLPKAVEPVFPDDEDVAAEAVRPGSKLPKQPAQTPLQTQTTPHPLLTTTLPPAKTLKQVGKAPEAATAGTAAKPAEAAPPVNETGTRLYLNVGSFSQKTHAFALQENLKQQGFSATVKEIVGDKGPVFKVRVGPMQDKARVQAVKNKLTQININSFVTPDD